MSLSSAAHKISKKPIVGSSHSELASCALGHCSAPRRIANIGNGLVALFGLTTCYICEKTRQALRGGRRVVAALQITRDGAKASYIAAIQRIWLPNTSRFCAVEQSKCSAHHLPRPNWFKGHKDDNLATRYPETLPQLSG